MNRMSRDVWFPAKRHGWGWGLPVAWQGRAGHVWRADAGRARWFPPTYRPLVFGLLAGAATIGLLVVCWLKGESPGQR